MKIPSDLRDRYPDQPGKEGRQCIHWLGSCRNCGDLYKRKTQIACPRCGVDRERCPKYVMHGRKLLRAKDKATPATEDTCDSHTRARTYSFYTMVADQISQEEWDAAIERVGDTHEQVLAIAQIALMRTAKKALAEQGDPGDLINRIEKYMAIIERHQKATRGELITLAWDDKIIRALKKKFRDYVRAIEDSLRTRVVPCPDCGHDNNIPESVRLEVMEDVKEATKLLGNRLTVPNATGGEVRFKPN